MQSLMKSVLVLSNDEFIMTPMALAILKHAAGTCCRILSPTARLSAHPLVTEALAEAGIEPFNPELGAANSQSGGGSDCAIVVISARNSKVVLSGERTYNWQFPKSVHAGDPIQAFRELRDQIMRHALSFFVKQLEMTNGGAV